MISQENETFVARLFRQYEIKIRKFLLLKKHNLEDVEDIIQDTFLKAHKVPNWQDVKNPEAYLVSMARNTFHDHVRKEIRSAIDQIEDEVIDGTPSPEQRLSDRQQLKELGDVINDLTPRLKQAIILVKVLGLSTSEASEIMGITKGALKNHIMRGMIACRKKIKENAEASLPEGQRVISLNDYKRAEYLGKSK